MTVEISWGTSSYTHTVCGQCGAILACSEPEIGGWEDTGYAWCGHNDWDNIGDDGPVIVFEPYRSDTCWHLCEPTPPGAVLGEE